ncbi:MAG: hypothetical protein J6T59_02510 [Bacteroidales bacterium]|nr:hypothetical protein [Bacteroidales bacterium]MBO7647047.1 hypothetical protein [Bacteroidales bacterium]
MYSKRKQNTTYQKKIEEIYQYYMSNGFDHSVEEIAARMGIAKKTFFNRYHSKENSAKLSFDLWMRNLAGRIRERQAACNNVVEALVVFVVEMQAVAVEEASYYTFAAKHNIMMDVKTPFAKIVMEVLQTGKQHYQILETLNIATYTTFFLFNVFHYVIDKKLDGDLIRYLLTPAMNERGKELMEFVIGSMDDA